MDIYVFMAPVGTTTQYKAEVFLAGKPQRAVCEKSISIFARKVRELAWESRESNPSDAIFVYLTPPASMQWLPGATRPERYGSLLSETDQMIFEKIFIRTPEEAKEIRESLESLAQK
jgi:hypothetical protein